ncbi:polyhydroxyalkanoic acid synthase subunit PhaR [Ectobacillus antri]|jgi:polyhydroxyalkanoic acid synthase PhaR subunit|uniref:Polyhydroxyalkanoic acid synthase subunit PhaR n=1 Tax=Ectobacillus antri TaxID=2486280 RepID=A0ABT6H3D1_9BACI|nr:polyhydroxyalkanoic acid synthase subunit PhaR [Ectobacillus antri]MDG4657450.1 polyhydroxyalkanoic acid synthase subunit PhaR [Ectobacillus antri]MDG5753763.1 polyhydroxyalkanoic acid synthase subunit PhaR [Ectobacillus antri]
MMDQKFDPMKAWKDAYDQTEKYWGKTLNETLKTEEYSAWMGSVLDMNLFYQKMINDVTKGYLEKMNVPTQEDIARVASLIVNLENKVDRIEEFLEDKMDGLEQSSTSKRDMTKLKSDLRILENKVDKILNYLEKANQPEESKR